MNNMNNPEKEWFGNKQVQPDQKTELVRGVFDSVAEKYDLMNDVMSFGSHRLWKDRLIRKIRPKNHQSFLDVAGGTGDIAQRIHKCAPQAQITICDLDEKMINVGRNRSIDKNYNDNFTWITGNAENLPFPDDSFDVYTISFGLRNVTRIDDALAEAYRTLKPGGAHIFSVPLINKHKPTQRWAERGENNEPAFLDTPSGKKRKVESYYGAGYLSQSSSKVWGYDGVGSESK